MGPLEQPHAATKVKFVLALAILNPKKQQTNHQLQLAINVTFRLWIGELQFQKVQGESRRNCRNK